MKAWGWELHLFLWFDSFFFCWISAIDMMLRAESFRVLQLLIVCIELAHKSEKKDTSFILCAVALLDIPT